MFEAKVNLVRVRRDEAVAIFTLIGVTGNMTAVTLDLPVRIYDPGYHYSMVKDKWAGFDTENRGASLFNWDMNEFFKRDSFFDFLD